jgi:hypothetical protein
MKLLKKEFASEEQWVEHQTILKRFGARAHDCMEHSGGFWVFYAIGVADHRFAIKYHSEGGTTLYYEHPSFDNASTLEELLQSQVKTE